MQAPRVVVFGGLNFDLIVETPRFAAPGETVEASRYHEMFGGKGGNQAVAAARMGAQVEMIGRVGADSYGEALLANLQAEGIGTSGVTIDPAASTGLAFVFIDDTGENTVTAVYGANSACGATEKAAAARLLEGASVLLVQQEVSASVTRKVMESARSQGVTVILDPAPARQSTAELLPLADIVTPNQSEAEILTGIPADHIGGAARAAIELRSQGPGVAIVTMGEHGAYIDSSEVSGLFPPFPVTPVASVAAGDAFAGALATCLAEGMPIEESMPRATAAAALSVTRQGAQESMPARDEVEALVQGRPDLLMPLGPGTR